MHLFARLPCPVFDIEHYGVPQGSVLGPLLFTTYISPLSKLASDLGITQQQYADDTQLLIAISPRDAQSNTGHRVSSFLQFGFLKMD
jgi:Reverse transcriptase (RNA-dependent DNA polymerase)